MKEGSMKIHDWNPDEGDALQGDVCLFRIPDSIKIDTSDEITAKNGRLILAEGEVTGHHHAIWDRNPPAMFREDGIGAGVSEGDTAAMVASATKMSVGTAKLYRDPAAVAELMRNGSLLTDALAIGVLVVAKAPVVLRHDEHDAIRIPPGRYYVGGQQEWDSAQARRVAD
jgi:hypothetical protein